MKRLPKRHYYRVGRIERGARYAWRDAYSYFTAEGHILYPWHTRGEAKAEAKRDGRIAVFHDEDYSDIHTAHDVEMARLEKEQLLSQPLSYSPNGTLRCDMTEDCMAAVTHIDNKGYVYCTKDGQQRREVRPCRKLRDWETRRLLSGKPLEKY